MTKAEVRKKLLEFVKAPVQLFSGEVTAVDEANYTVDIKPFGQAEISDARLKAGIDGEKTGIVEIPEVGSSVLVGLIGNDADTVTVIKCSKVAKIIINNGSNGGLLIDENVDNNLKEIRSYISDLKTAVSNGLNAVGAGSSANGATGKAAFESGLSGKSIVFENMKNDKITH